MIDKKYLYPIFIGVYTVVALATLRKANKENKKEKVK